jgi:N-acetyllactosaminide beta-1,3-N-acetylglucosaminyltransferase
VLEAKLAGYVFYVLTPIFTCHWGMYKDRRSAKRPAWRERQNNHNNKIFQHAKKELSAKYGRVIP